jgi:hypothetical protein|tara:strand:+ start:286 stop:567 length:282 start_codon:yes stop_codon:yes gene_type:complete
MKVKPTFFNTRKERLHWDYTDTNSWVFIILFDSGAEHSFILRDLKKDKNILKHIYNKLQQSFDNIAEIEISKLNVTEYNLMKQMNIPSVIKVC